MLKDRLGRLASAVRGVLEHEAERRRHADAERVIRDSETRLRAIFERAPVACAITDTAGTVHDVNHAFTALLGYTRDQVAGTRLADLAHADDRADARERIRAAGPAAGAAAETRWLHRDGHVLRGRFTLSAANIGGQPLRVGQLVCRAGAAGGYWRRPKFPMIQRRAAPRASSMAPRTRK